MNRRHAAENGTITGYDSATTVTATFVAGFNLFDILAVSAQASETFEWDYQKTTGRESARVLVTNGRHTPVNLRFAE